MSITTETETGRGRRRLYCVAGCACVGLAAVGMAVPLLPTTPFLLLAAWLFSKSSPALHRRLQEDPRFGPLVRAWQEERAIPVKAKLAGVAAILASWSGLALTAEAVAVPAVAAVVMAPVGAFIATRPSPRRGRTEAKSMTNKAGR